MSSPRSLIANNVNLKIGQHQILSDICLNIGAGKVMGVLGPNGAGKTSLLKMLSGQLNSHNSVSWNNKTLTDYDPMSLAQQIAVVNQLNESVFALDLYQIVRMGLLPHKSLLSRHTADDEKSIKDAISRVGLDNKAQQTFSSLSGGEQQRGLIARALVQKAALIILDEPVNHLDVYYQYQVLSLLRSLAHNLNITVVMSLHELNLAANYCDHLCLLDQGKMVSQGTPEQVLTAERLQQVFKIPCQIRHDGINSAFRVDFYAPDEVELDTSPAGKEPLDE
ncbi:ABC transporter ATP-binding protein [Paraglaciecola arctica]|uniref:Hemin import ATP-binding protein HmuV n=1 Tax=Paraglaciecola arctica BSs20135 TaxID=493475 RepID=K6YC64_9ALTE|nr:ABC transporter ATP-binding protein [Paraglaciecola arctica]GAC21551.1 hemin import ATP-binding protein HmuV [Paraglaciecola arctica BSs20135]